MNPKSFSLLSAKEYRAILTQTFSRPRYQFLTTLVALLFYSLFALLRNYLLLTDYVAAGQFKETLFLTPTLVLGFPSSVPPETLILNTLISLVIGINISLSLFKLELVNGVAKGDAGTLFGTIVTAFGPACPSCATSLLAGAAGSSLFSILPFGGHSLKVVSLLILLITFIWLSNKVKAGGACDL